MEPELNDSLLQQHYKSKMDKTFRCRFIAILKTIASFGCAVLLGCVISLVPWKSSNGSLTHNKSESWTVAKIENDPDILAELISLESSSFLNTTEKAQRLLSIYPVFDGHNDLPWNIRKIFGNKLNHFDFTNKTFVKEVWTLHNNSARSHTDIPRLNEGQVGAQFWSVFVDCDSQGKDAVVQTLEQIDVIKRLIDKYPDYLKFCTTAECVIKTSFNKTNGKIASLIGVECGHSIQNSAAVLRQIYDLGVRYMALTNDCSTPWADANPVDDNVLKAVNNGLSGWGLELIEEMNRIGMMVDLSHVSEATMIAALKRSKAPVIFSHSGVKSVCNVSRNVGDEVLNLLKNNGGIIMIQFYNDFVYCRTTPRKATLDDVIYHIKYVRDLIGVDYIGLGGNYDGAYKLPEGLQDVSKYPQLFARMIEKGWKLEDLRKIAFTNILRVMENVERVKNDIESSNPKYKPMESLISQNELKEKGFIDDEKCLSEKSLNFFN